MIGTDLCDLPLLSWSENRVNFWMSDFDLVISANANIKLSSVNRTRRRSGSPTSGLETKPKSLHDDHVFCIVSLLRNIHFMLRTEVRSENSSSSRDSTT